VLFRSAALSPATTSKPLWLAAQEKANTNNEVAVVAGSPVQRMLQDGAGQQSVWSRGQASRASTVFIQQWPG
jgi:hypothetical protein